MMQKLTNDPAFWAWLWTLLGLLFTASGALLGLVIAWAKAKTAQLDARTAHREASAAKDSATAVAVGQGYQQQTIVQHTAAIAALQATTAQGAGDRRGATDPAVVPAAAPVQAAAWPPPPQPEQDSPPPPGT